MKVLERRRARLDAQQRIVQAANGWLLRRYRGSGLTPTLLSARQRGRALQIATTHRLVDDHVLVAAGGTPPTGRRRHPLEGVGVTRPPRPERRRRRRAARARTTTRRPGGRH